MEENNIMNNEEIIEVTEEIVNKTTSHKVLKIAAGVGLTVIVGGIAYNYIIKPAIVKRKAKKEVSVEVDETVDYEDVDMAENEIV